jgi:hypothetical protein
MTTGLAAWLRVVLFPLLGLGLVAARPDIFPPKDFPEYWAAAHVFAGGGDPYSGADLLPVQQAITGDHDSTKAVSLWTPPWTLPLYLPFGFLPFTPSRFVWIFAQLAMVFAAVELLWRTYRQGSRHTPCADVGIGTRSVPTTLIPHLLAAVFAPVFWMALFGQNTGFLLLGLAGFLHFRDTRPFLAGAFAALTAIKPHLLAVFGVLLVLDVVRRDGWKVLLAGVGMLVVGSLVSLAVNPHVFELFVEAVRRPETPETVPLRDWHVPLVAWELRHALDPHRFWIQFVPCAVAGVAMAGYSLTRRQWDWRTQLPAVVLVSCLFAPYGGWMFDLVVLLVPVVHAAAVLSPRPSFVGAPLVGARSSSGHPQGVPLQTKTLWPVAVLLGFLVVSLYGFLIRGLEDPIWFTPAVAGLYAAALVVSRRS